MTTTDTPRTDAYTDRWNGWDVIPAEVSRQLERELAEAKAEVERLRANLRRAIEIAEEMAGDNWPTEHPLYTELHQLKESIK